MIQKEGFKLMAYKVVLVDDEPWSMISLKKNINWADAGFEIIAEFQNSVQALEFIEQSSPDAVFTDIRMPVISGIELMKKARGKGLNIEFVIVSGFAEFSYAQEAVRLGAFEYCLKPVDSQKTIDILKRLKLHLDKVKKTMQVNHGKGFGSCQEDAVGNIPSNIDNENFKKMLQYLNDNFYKKIKLKELSNRFFLHPNYTCYLFNKLLGTTFSDYLKEIRMKHAAEFLKKRELTIKEVANKAGYDDYFYFNKVFKKHYGSTPTEYRKNKV